MEHIYLIPLSLLGVIVSYYIFHKKTKKQVLVCMVGENCDDVVRSKYGKTFGLENSIGGILYYGLVLIATLAQQYAAVAIPHTLRLIVSGGAVAFSLYLTYVQFGVLKKWCEYCIVSALVTLGIFLIVLL